MLFSPTLYRVELVRQLRNIFSVAFAVAMPVAMYLLFGVSMSYASDRMGHGNVSFYIMVSMAAYGTATAMSALCSRAAAEAGQGWGRTLAMTPLTTAGYAVTKLASAVTYSALSVAIVFAVGLATGARADDAWRWLAAAGIALGIGMMFGLFGLGIGLLLGPDSAAAVAGIAITFFGFFGNVFIPLDGVMLKIAAYTPMYGYVALVRWPITDGELVSGGSDAVWAVCVNVVAWAVVFAVLVWWGAARARRRR